MSKKNGPVKMFGLETAPEFYIDGIASIQFLGVNTRYVLYKNVHDRHGQLLRRAVFTVVMPTGALPRAIAQLIGFAHEHRMKPDHDASRSS